MIDLETSRKNIDEIDRQIVDLFEKRMVEADEVAKYKLQTGKPVFDKTREEDKLKNLGRLSHNDFNKRAVRELFGQIMSISRKYQYGQMAETEPLTDFTKIDKLPQDTSTTVVYYGIEGTHTQQAMEAFFGTDTKGIACPSFRGVMEMIENEEADYGVLPIENSSTGGISDNYDLLLDYNHAIVGQYVHKINQCLIAVPGTKIKNIKKVYSHPQGLLQCSEFLEQHPEMKAVDYASTAECARKVSLEGEKNQAAIASRKAAEVYGLEVLADSIQQEHNNSTRFIVISKQKIYIDKSDKLALCIELPHKSGSLYSILSHFIYNDLNLTQIESRPIKGKSWEYRFFIDVEGNLEMSSVKNALRGIKEEAAYLRVLGNFKS